jgi:hypothetical protein
MVWTAICKVGGCLDRVLTAARSPSHILPTREIKIEQVDVNMFTIHVAFGDCVSDSI